MFLPSPNLITQTSYAHPNHSFSTDTHKPSVIYPLLHLSVFCIMFRSATSRSHLGLAIFNPTDFPTQWVLVLSANELFQGRVLCSTIGMTVNGWKEIWTECEYSPASFNPAATFAGVIHIDMLTVPMEHVRSEIQFKGNVSHVNPTYTDKYVLQVLRIIGDRGFGFSSFSREKELYEAIQSRIPVLNKSSRSNSLFPVASLSLDGVRFGKI
ncbi:hypothetical protein F5888DRAFT_264101 [Russula emetica]|nr:hypothetical protein F5888DRAFT_264101 [Russula emetica]